MDRTEVHGRNGGNGNAGIVWAEPSNLVAVITGDYELTSGHNECIVALRLGGYFTLGEIHPAHLVAVQVVSNLWQNRAA